MPAAQQMYPRKSDDAFSWLRPPATMVDPQAWDKFWRDRITHGVAGYVDMFCDDGTLVDAMRTSGFQTVLCVGNGLSQEPRALASAGFGVTALDLSPLAAEANQGASPPPSISFVFSAGGHSDRMGAWSSWWATFAMSVSALGRLML